MSIALYLKENLKHIPPGIGQWINHIPFGLRPGLSAVYRQRRAEIQQLSNEDPKVRRAFVLNRIKKLVQHSYSKIPFYRTLYDKHGFDPHALETFADIQRIPMITKSMLNEFPMEQRSFPVKHRYLVNTGGSSGSPFSFYNQPDSMGHEWAHMHTIWEKLGYRYKDFKMVFGGRSNVKDLVDYDVLRNSFAVDIYAPYSDISRKLKKILRKHKIKYLHGYPASIYDFALYCQHEDPELRDLLSAHIRGGFWDQNTHIKQIKIP